MELLAEHLAAGSQETYVRGTVGFKFGSEVENVVRLAASLFVPSFKGIEAVLRHGIEDVEMFGR